MALNKTTFTILVIVCLTRPICAQEESKTRLKNFNHEKSLAIEGYDPVAYFTEGKAIEGSPAISLTEKGITYRFVTQKNKESFKADPGKYEPQYGGWCAYAMGSTGEKVEIDPETFKIIEGKLYLFYNAYFNNTLKKWNEDEAKLKAKADSNWNLTTQR